MYKKSREIVKKKILKRDKFECIFCKEKDIKKLVMHHIDGEEKFIDNRGFFEKNNRSTNLIIVCRTCHAQLHSLIRKDRKLGKRLAEIRNKIINQIWKEKIMELSMQELGKIFGLTTVHIYRILKVESKKESENKSDFSI